MSDLLSKSTSTGIKRRRLYHIQQALEKTIKGYFPVLIVELRGLPRMIDYRMEFEKRPKFSGSTGRIVKSRIEMLATELTKPKDLGHDPGGKIELKELVENMCLYLDLMGVPKDEAKLVTDALESFEKFIQDKG